MQRSWDQRDGRTQHAEIMGPEGWEGRACRDLLETSGRVEGPSMQGYETWVGGRRTEHAEITIQGGGWEGTSM
eukprot:350116-Chlamydomonas_euryale.AAC.1